MLAPKYSTSVAPANNGQTIGQPNGGGQQNPANDALAYVKQIMRTASQTPQYDPVYNNIYEDKTLAEFKAESGENSAESTAYFRHHASQYVLQFYTEVKAYRHGTFYNIFKETVENYAMLNTHGFGSNVSHVKQEYVNTLLSRVDLMDNVGVRASVWFGYCVSGALKQSNGSSPGRNKITDAVRVAVLNILNLEIVLWLNGSNKAKPYLYNPTPEITELLNKFNVRKEAASAVFQYFEETSPYDAANFSGDQRSDGNISMIMPELTAIGRDLRIPQNTDSKEGFYDHTGSFTPDFYDNRSAEDQELIRNSYEMAARGRQGQTNFRSPIQQRSTGLNEEWEQYGTVGQQYRKDLHNVDKNNVHQFDIPGYFRPTGLDNWYLVKETDWVFIKEVLVAGYNQRREDTILKNCVRVINYDFNEPRTGWKSRVIRIEDMDKDLVLSDPAKLLPLLRDETPLPEYNLNDEGMDLNDFYSDDEEDGNSKYRNFVAKMREPGYDYRVIDNHEKIESETPSTIVEKLYIAGHAVSQETDREIAIIGEVTALGRRLFDNKGKRDAIVKRFPMLFKGSKAHEDDSYFNIVERIAKSLKSYPVDQPETDDNDRFDKFISARLTADINNWFISSCGYSAKNEKGPHLDVDDILKDIVELKEYLFDNDKEVFEKLNEKNADIVLTQQMMIFDPIEELPEGTSNILRAEADLNIKRSRHYNVITICNENGPKPTKGETIKLRRSTNPEFFILLDALKKRLESKNKRFGSENILVMYKNTNDVFLVSQMVYEENVVSLRTVITSRSLTTPAFG